MHFIAIILYFKLTLTILLWIINGIIYLVQYDLSPMMFVYFGVILYEILNGMFICNIFLKQDIVDDDIYSTTVCIIIMMIIKIICYGIYILIIVTFLDQNIFMIIYSIINITINMMILIEIPIYFYIQYKN